MYNRYQGNIGKVVRVEEKQETWRPGGEKPRAPAPAPAGGQLRPRDQQPPAPPRTAPRSDPISSISSLLQNSLGGLETDDIILLLILYLMYRESGDSDLLIIMGAMFLL